MRSGRAILDDAPSEITDSDPKDWPQPVLRLFRKQLTPAQVGAIVASAQFITNGQKKCQLPFFLGEFALTHGELRETRAKFEQVLADCSATLGEAIAARTELGGLK